MAPVMKAFEHARGEQGIDKVLPKDDPRILARLFMGINSQMDDIMDEGMVGPDKLTRATDGGFKWLLEPLDITTGKGLANERKEVAAYMVAQRTIEKAKQFGREKTITGAGGGIATDVAAAEKTLAEIAANPEKKARFDEAARRYRQWADANLQYLVSQGRLSKEQYEAIKANNEQYVAMQRIVEVTPDEDLQIMGGAGGKLGSSPQVVHKFKGSTLTIRDPYESLMDATYKAVREADRNQIMRAFTDVLIGKRGLHEGKPVDVASVGRLAKQGDKQTITVYRDGKQEHWQFHPDVYRAVKGLQEGIYKFPWIVRLLPSLLRGGIVNALPFAIKNATRDAWQRFIISVVGSKPWDTLKKYTPMEKSDLKKFGGDQAGHYYQDEAQYGRAMKTAIKELSQDKNTIVALGSKLGRGYMDFMQASERQGRLAEYRAAYKKATTEGVDLGDGQRTVLDEYNAHLFANAKARELLDFAVAGEAMVYINQVVPFSNAAVQGIRVNAKAIERDPATFARRWVIMAAMPSVMNYLWNFANGDIEEYRQLPAWRRDLFYNFKIGDNLWLSLPKAFEIGVLGTSTERTLDYALGNKDAFSGHAKQIFETLMPVDEAALVGPFQVFVQAATNYDLFRQKHIVPTWEENLELGLRSTHRASRLGQAIQKVVGVDARKIDYLARGQFGYFGQYATKLSDIGRETRKGFGLEDTGFFKRGAGAQSLDVKWLRMTAAERGAEQSKPWKAFKDEYLSPYYEAQSDEERERLAKDMRTAAKRLRQEWEATPPRPEAEIKQLARELDVLATNEWKQFHKAYVSPYNRAERASDRKRLAHALKSAAGRLRRKWETQRPKKKPAKRFAKGQGAMPPFSLTSPAR